MRKGESAPAASSQVNKFREAAREAETDDREEVFDATLKRIVKAQPPKEESKKGK